MAGIGWAGIGWAGIAWAGIGWALPPTVELERVFDLEVILRVLVCQVLRATKCYMCQAFWSSQRLTVVSQVNPCGDICGQLRRQCGRP